jgi:dihydrofolate reductase
MRRLRYQVASSLDGYIAGAKGELDWIVMDPEIDFGELFKQYDTVVMGRRTFEVMLKEGGNGAMPGLDVVVFSQRLRQKDFPAVSVVNADPAESIRSLKAKPGKDMCSTAAVSYSAPCSMQASWIPLNLPSFRCC